MTTTYAGDVTSHGQSVALNANWLDSTASNNAIWTQPTYYYAWSSPKVRLTMTEVERLRVRAKKDKQLREILSKFTDHIEVTVDFGDGDKSRG